MPTASITNTITPQEKALRNIFSKSFQESNEFQKILSQNLASAAEEKTKAALEAQLQAAQTKKDQNVRFRGFLPNYDKQQALRVLLSANPSLDILRSFLEATKRG